MSENKEVQSQDDIVDASYDAPPPAYLAFELIKERALFVNLNIRAENHGDEKVPACDLTFELSAPNSILKKIRPGLVESLYEHDRQRDVEGDFMRKLKHPQIGTIPYDWEVPRVRLEIHDAMDASHNVVMAGGKANKFKITALDGGTVKLKFRVQFSEFDEEQTPGLVRCNKQTVTISLASAEEEAKPDNFQQAELLGSAPDQMSEERKKAEAAFGKIDEEAQLAQAAEGMQGGADASNVAPITAAKPRGKRTANGAAINAE